MVGESIKVEGQLRSVVEDISEREDMSLLDTGQMLVDEGIKVKQSGEPKLSGPFGVSRPFSKISFGGVKTELRIRVSDDQIPQARNLFDERTKTENLRQALRLGAIVESDEEMEIQGPGGVIRPFADVE